VGRTLAELNLSGNAVVACIIRNDEVVIPTGDSMLLVNDHLLIVTTPQNHALALARLLGSRG
jgi:trk system potassium uptake protein